MKNLISIILFALTAITALGAPSIKYNLATTNQAFGFLQGANITIVTNANGSITITAAASAGTALTNASLSGVQLINPLTNAVLTLNPTNGMSAFTNATGVVIGPTNSGAVLKMRIYNFTNQVSTALTIPADATIPQISEGYGVTTNTYTPVSSNSVIYVAWEGFVTSSGTFNVIGALFRDSNTNAIGASIETVESADRSRTLVVRSSGYTNSTTTPINFSYNVGGVGASTTYINRNSGTANLLGGVLTSRMTVVEVLQ